MMLREVITLNSAVMLFLTCRYMEVILFAVISRRRLSVLSHEFEIGHYAIICLNLTAWFALGQVLGAALYLER